MSLGEAFIEIRADLRPFARDLRRNVRPIIEAFERDLGNAIGRATGDDAEGHGRRAGDRISRGIQNSMIHMFRNNNPFIAIAAMLGSALDDGISALPTEVKAAIVAGILLAVPIVSAFLTGALVAAIGVGVAGLGVALASQFTEVQVAASVIGRNIRNILVDTAFSFGQAIISNLSLIESRLQAMSGLFADIFDLSSPFLEPLTQGLLEGVRELGESLRDSLGDMKPFIDELGAGIMIVLNSIGKAIELLTRSGQDGVKALRDLFALIGALITAAAALLLVFTKVYGVIRDLVTLINRFTGGLSIPLIVLGRFFELIDNRSNRLRGFVNTNTDLGNSFSGLIEATDGETQALKDYLDQLEKVSNQAKSNLELNIRWEESLDRLSEALDKNGRNIDITTKKGQENVKAFIEGLKIAEERALLRVQRGEMTAEAAAAQYQKEINQLRILAREAGISEQAFNDLFGEIIATSEIRISGQDIGIDELNNDLLQSVDAATKLHNKLTLIKNLSSFAAGVLLGGFQGFAEGGFHFLPNIVKVAEDGPEVTIPLTKPARAAALLQQSGLSSMLSGGGNTQFMVYIGNEQLDSHMVRVVQRNNKFQEMALSTGGRQM